MFKLMPYAFSLVLISTIALAPGCATETGQFVNALTGDECEPDFETFNARGREHVDNGHGRGNTSPTGIPGDNLDDERSGHTDCLGDGNSGHGDDKKHNCEVPPGCDAQGCCESDVPGDDGNDDGDGGGDDGGGEDEGGPIIIG